ncbi:calphotin [Manduca sexta]|uniref:calphotin n=1 Tax=Manduca sexta TaxID=7130 RepID=UPI001183A24E|nr:calphotin [Manduca sexta]
MKFIVAFAALVAVAVASPVKRPMPMPDNISIGPALVDIGPAIVDFPIPAPCDAGAVVPSPVVIGDLSPEQPAPLVQIIVNVNQAGLAPAPVGPKPDPVIVVDEAEAVPIVVDPVDVVDVVPVVDVDPVAVVDVVPVVDVDPVNVVDISPVVDVSPVQVVDLTPVIDVGPVGVVEISPVVAPEPVHVVDNGVLVNTPVVTPIHH